MIMGLGSLQNSPFLDMDFRTLAEANHGEAEGGGEPPAAKRPRACSPRPPFPGTLDPVASDHTRGRTNHSASTIVPAHPRGSPPRLTKEIHGSVLPKPDHHASTADLEGSNESQEGSSLCGNNEDVGDGCDLRDMDGEERFSSSFSSSFASSSCLSGVVRRQRKFIPDNRKDETYWEKRRKNNEAARKSREKRRLHDLMLENRIVDLEEDNSRLRVELHSLKKRYGIPLDTVFVGQERTELVKQELSPPVAVNHCGRPARTGEEGMPPGLTRISDSSSPPLLALSTRVLPAAVVQQTGPTGVFPTQASSLPFFMSALPAELPPAHTPSTCTVVHPRIPPAHQHDTAVVVKRESEEDETGLHCSLLRQESYQGDRMRECREIYPRYASDSPRGSGVFISQATIPAHNGWSEAVPTRYNLDHSTIHLWQGSPLSSHSSDDTSDEPLQLTVHRRGSKTESLEEDSGNEGISVNDGHCTSNSRISPHSSLPLKLRHKIPSHSPPYPVNPGELSTTGGQSLVNGLIPAETGTTRGPCPINGLTHLSEPVLTQDAPLSLVKKEATVSTETAYQEINGCRDQTDPKYRDPKYLERRRRNNEAARKCRENRRNMTRLWEAKSDYLQSENSQLRQELDALQEEMKQLMELLDKRRQEQNQGQETSEQQLALSQKQTERLQQLQEEHRLLKLEQERHEKRRKKRYQRQMINNLLSDALDDHRDMN